MALAKPLVSASTGASATYHRITDARMDLLAGVCQATVMSYVSEDARRAGLQPLEGESIQVLGLPGRGQCLLEHLYRALSESHADSALDGQSVGALPAANRYKFSGAAES